MTNVVPPQEQFTVEYGPLLFAQQNLHTTKTNILIYREAEGFLCLMASVIIIMNTYGVFKITVKYFNYFNLKKKLYTTYTFVVRTTHNHTLFS